jgi:hypothetical protein
VVLVFCLVRAPATGLLVGLLACLLTGLLADLLAGLCGCFGLGSRLSDIPLV